jgi:hypothetical protein
MTLKKLENVQLSNKSRGSAFVQDFKKVLIFAKNVKKNVKKCVLALIKAPPKTVKLVKWNRIYKAAISHSGLGPECDIAAL